MIYLFDGSFEGLLTCVFEAYKDKDAGTSIRARNVYTPSFLDETRFVETDMDKFQRVYSSVAEKISHHARQIIYRAWLSESEDAPDLILHFLRTGYKLGRKVENFIQDPHIADIIDLNRRVGFEVHRFMGLLRFQEISKGVFYAGYEPDHNITVLLAPHFTQRLASQPFIVHDKKRNLCAVFDGQEMIMTDHPPRIPGDKTGSEDEYSSLWKAFFKTVAIQERKNPRTQMQFMPKRYWKNLTEFQD
jgi:probable DNA metabolism protein